ncbi:MAG TPA: DUF2442 domain-containing protein [Longimicrobium sp.]|jgi:hypothetical protein|nr:DUF2442 domain-containing protein [Longimicrobium sp.]
MFLHVLRVTPLRDYSLRLEFNDGTVRDIDLSSELHGEVFEPLRDPSLFAQVIINPETGTVEWPNGADFAPEFLSRVGREVQRVA